MISDDAIKKAWFGEHKATLTKQGELTVLDWKKPASNIYSIRFIFDGYKVYISGDIGFAVFWLTWIAEINSFANLDAGYFASKLKAFDGEANVIDTKLACEQFDSWLNEENNPICDYFNDKDKEEIAEIKIKLKGCSGKSELQEMLFCHSKLLHSIDEDYYCSLASIGEVIHPRIRAYLIVLKMASEQLKAGAA